jgi:FHA domain
MMAGDFSVAEMLTLRFSRQITSSLEKLNSGAITTSQGELEVQKPVSYSELTGQPNGENPAQGSHVDEDKLVSRHMSIRKELHSRGPSSASDAYISHSRTPTPRQEIFTKTPRNGATAARASHISGGKLSDHEPSGNFASKQSDDLLNRDFTIRKQTDEDSFNQGRLTKSDFAQSVESDDLHEQMMVFNRKSRKESAASTNTIVKDVPHITEPTLDSNLQGIPNVLEEEVVSPLTPKSKSLSAANLTDVGKVANNTISGLKKTIPKSSSTASLKMNEKPALNTDLLPANVASPPLSFKHSNPVLGSPKSISITIGGFAHGFEVGKGSKLRKPADVSEARSSTSEFTHKQSSSTKSNENVARKSNHESAAHLKSQDLPKLSLERAILIKSEEHLPSAAAQTNIKEILSLKPMIENAISSKSVVSNAAKSNSTSKLNVIRTTSNNSVDGSSAKLKSESGVSVILEGPITTMAVKTEEVLGVTTTADSATTALKTCHDLDLTSKLQVLNESEWSRRLTSQQAEESKEEGAHDTVTNISENLDKNRDLMAAVEVVDIAAQQEQLSKSKSQINASKIDVVVEKTLEVTQPQQVDRKVSNRTGELKKNLSANKKSPVGALKAGDKGTAIPVNGSAALLFSPDEISQLFQNFNSASAPAQNVEMASKPSMQGQRSDSFSKVTAPKVGVASMKLTDMPHVKSASADKPIATLKLDFTNSKQGSQKPSPLTPKQATDLPVVSKPVNGTAKTEPPNAQLVVKPTIANGQPKLKLDSPRSATDSKNSARGPGAPYWTAMIPVVNEFQVIFVPLNAMSDIYAYIVEPTTSIRLGRNNLNGHKRFKAFGTLVVSRNHLDISLKDGKVFFFNQMYVKDIGSSSGTFRNNVRLSQTGQSSPEVEILTGDYIQLGRDFTGENDQLDEDGRVEGNIDLK